MDYRWHYFRNYGFIETQFTNEQLKPIKDEIEAIQSNFDNEKNIKFNKRLAGNIKREFALSENSKLHLEKLLLPSTAAYNKEFNYTKTEKQIRLSESWVNFQKKHEFNPIHKHIGVYSFVIWIKVPYLMQDEILNSPGAESNTKTSGQFMFYYTNSLGEILECNLAVDKTFENKSVIFPASMKHAVNPFYSSDEYRISVSGNFKVVE